MAEKEKTFSLSDLSKKRKDQSGSMNLFNSESDFIHTGNYMLNALIGAKSLTGGYPERTIVCVAGENSTGKTFLCLNAVKAFQDAGYSVKWYDSEGAIRKSNTASFGINTQEDFWDYKLVSTIEAYRTEMTNDLQDLIDAKRAGKEIPKMLFVLDSAGMLASEKEVADALSGSDKTDMTRAKIMKSVFRILTPKLVEIGATLMFTNHTYQTMEMYSKPKQGGGEGLQFAASLIIFLSKAQLKEGDDKNGIIVTAKTQKNRFARPHFIKFHIHFSKGMNPYIGLHEYISWENCGIALGKIVSKNEFLKLKEKFIKEETAIAQIESTEYSLPNDQIYYYVTVDNMKKLKLTGLKKFAIKHLATEIEVDDLFTDKVFTPEVLELLDNNVITPKFSYGTSNKDSFDHIFSDDEESDIETTELSDFE